MKIDDLFGERDFLEHLELETELTQDELFEITNRTRDSHNKKYLCSVVRFIGCQPIEFTFASRINKKNQLETQCVMKLIPEWSYCFMKNMYFASMGGWIVVWDKKRRASYSWDNSDYNKWYISSKPEYYLDCINCQELKKNDEFKYSNIRFGMAYFMTIYRKFKSLEILNKLNCVWLATSYKFMELLEENKTFKKFFIKMYNQIKEWKKYNNGRFTAEFYLWCWNRNINDLDKAILARETAQKIDQLTKEVNDNVSKNFVQKNGLNVIKLYEYKDKIKQSIYTYCDYLRACEFLRLDFKNTKVLYPNDFQHWHDYYTSQMEAIKDARIDNDMNLFAKANNAIEKKFKGYNFILPTCSQDLIDEGEALDHCVGRMNYNKKISEGKTFIVFVRVETDTPLYTMEVNQVDKKLLQFYGKNDTLPPDEVKGIVLDWIDKYRDKVIPMELVREKTVYKEGIEL